MGLKLKSSWQASLVPRPKKEEKGPGFSHLCMHLIAVEFHFRPFVTQSLILNIKLSVDLMWRHMACKESCASRS